MKEDFFKDEDFEVTAKEKQKTKTTLKDVIRKDVLGELEDSDSDDGFMKKARFETKADE